MNNDQQILITQAEARLMKAAAEFGHPFGRDQTVHPRMYWVEMHIEAWRELSAAAVNYADATSLLTPCCTTTTIEQQ
jgi:hypothetical protein